MNLQTKKLILFTNFESYLHHNLNSNRENREHQNYFWNVIALEEISQSGVRNYDASNNVN